MSTSLRLRLISSVVDFEPFSIDWNKKHLFEKQISEFNKFVADAANRIGIQLTSRTKHEKLLERIHLATNGVIGKIFNLFVFAEGRAKQLGQETVDLSILAWAYDVRLSESQNLDETSNKKRNPFKRKFDTRTYPVSINDVEATNQPTKSAEITTRFAHRVEPYVDETVISWLLRITFVNRYVDLDFMLRFFKYTFELTYLSNQQLNRDTDKRIIELFSDLARVPTEKLRSQSLQNYWSHLVVPERSVKAQSEGVLNLFRALVNDHPRICPICLHESTYIRQKWHLDPYCICEAHGTAMIDTCLNCGEVYEIEDIFRDCCSACGSRFSAETILLADISEQLPTQTRIINWIENGEHQLPDLPEKSFDTIMTVIYGLVDSVIKRQPPGKHCTPTTKAELYELAMEVIEDPSTYFYAYLNEYRNNQSQTEQYGFEAEFGTLYSKWLIGYWNSSEFDFIHEAFNEYLYTEFVPYDGITNAKWLHLYPDFWDKSDFISVQSAVKQNRALKLSKLLLAIHAQQLQLHVAPDSYSQYVRKSDLRRFILNLD
ncbi:MAG: TniQ family protein [Chloroflexota bacterium]